MEDDKLHSGESSLANRKVNGSDTRDIKGQSKDHKIELYIRFYRPVYQEILQYARSNISTELGGVLLGNYEKIEKKYYIVIEAAIKALYTKAGKSTLKFTHETWDYVDRIREEKYPGMKMVGWFHTHPGFGVFLSAHDKFIQTNFFDLPWQIAYVIDPIQGKQGYFGSVNSKVINVSYVS